MSKPAPDPDRPKVPDVVRFAEAIYAEPMGGAGCCLHSVLDDGNLGDGSLTYAMNHAEHERCRLVATFLFRMTMSQRRRVYARVHCIPRRRRAGS